MQIEKIVINASPFILLAKSGYIELLPQLFKEIRIPESVSQEIIAGDDLATEILKVCEKLWLVRFSVNHADEVKLWNLGEGETEVLSFALTSPNEFRAVIDDRAARNCAQTLGIKILGTGGILVLAKKRGLIDSVSEAVEKLQNDGLYIAGQIVNLLKRQAGE